MSKTILAMFLGGGIASAWWAIGTIDNVSPIMLLPAFILTVAGALVMASETASNWD